MHAAWAQVLVRLHGMFEEQPLSSAALRDRSGLFFLLQPFPAERAEYLKEFSPVNQTDIPMFALHV
jgi:hypothetical protein